MDTRSDNPHELSALHSTLQDRMRNTGIQYGERNFLGNNTLNNAGVAKGGAFQAKRYVGTYNSSTIVGP